MFSVFICGMKLFLILSLMTLKCYAVRELEWDSHCHLVCGEDPSFSGSLEPDFSLYNVYQVCYLSQGKQRFWDSFAHMWSRIHENMSESYDSKMTGM